MISLRESEHTFGYPIQRPTFYVWGTDLCGNFQGAGGVGGLLAVHYGNSSTSLPYFDRSGNIMGYCIAETGECAAQFEYGPFGQVIHSTDRHKTRFRFGFSTNYQDPETDLLYYGFRYYDP